MDGCDSSSFPTSFGGFAADSSGGPACGGGSSFFVRKRRGGVGSSLTFRNEKESSDPTSPVRTQSNPNSPLVPSTSCETPARFHSALPAECIPARVAPM